jgi:DNA-directed RNA polymerase beta' subunit
MSIPPCGVFAWRRSFAMRKAPRTLITPRQLVKPAGHAQLLAEPGSRAARPQFAKIERGRSRFADTGYSCSACQ